MKKKVLGMLAIASVLFSKGFLYPTCMEVTNLDFENDIVTLETSEGFVYEMYGCEDYYVGDLASVVMFNNMTFNTITDDIIVSANYAGYWIDDDNKVTTFKN